MIYLLILIAAILWTNIVFYGEDAMKQAWTFLFVPIMFALMMLLVFIVYVMSVGSKSLFIHIEDAA